MLKIADGKVINNQNNIAYNWIDHMKKGDTLKLTITGHKLYTDGARFVFFNGYSLVILLFTSNSGFHYISITYFRINLTVWPFLV